MLLKPPSIKALWRVWRGMVNLSPVRRLFCIIDGVDRCDERSLAPFLRKLDGMFVRQNERQASHNVDHKKDPLQIPSSERTARFAKSTPSPRLRMIILSRDNSSFVINTLLAYPRLELKGHGTQGGAPNDLKCHIDSKVDHTTKSFSETKALSKENTAAIVETLSHGQDQTYEWVKFAAEKLMSIAPGQLREVAAKMPVSVDDMYAEELLDVPSRRKAHVCAILKWVALAAKPLSPLDFSKAVKYSLGKSFSVRMLRKALHDVPRLIEGNDREVHLASSAVQDFLLSEQSILRLNKRLREFANLSKSRRVRLKPTDILKPVDEAFFAKHPFLEYAMVHWTTHAKQGNARKTDYKTDFFRDDSLRRKLWWESYWISLRQKFAWKWTAPGHFSLLHLAAIFDIVPLAAYVQDQGFIQELLSAEDDQGVNPLNWAAQRSNAAMVKFLFQRGAFDDRAPREVARTGDASIIKMLLDNRKRNLNSPKSASPKSPSNPLWSIKNPTLSCISDWSKSSGGDNSAPMSPDAQGYGKTTSETPLHIAATCGNEEAVDALLAASELCNTPTEGGWTCLHNAAWFGRVTIVRRLVDAGADSRLGTNEGMTPLHCAVKNKQEAVVEDMFNSGAADVEVVNGFGFTPFHMPAKPMTRP
ncbi:uncharacterized protein LTR77_011179 [Saxophila tyrrhenica]|uniref:Uncharacterized protein n=1 Tax=Saxophila tyrrhenica TaxID=1690608 RepID=A0AAV9NT94_9PEZI|nr:hypothetical protein LTR77_011179 [Saxophila tyrrhenica]